MLPNHVLQYDTGMQKHNCPGSSAVYIGVSPVTSLLNKGKHMYQVYSVEYQPQLVPYFSAMVSRPVGPVSFIVNITV